MSCWTHCTVKHSRTAMTVGRGASPAHGRCPIRNEATKRSRLAEKVGVAFDCEATTFASLVSGDTPSRKYPSSPSMSFNRPMSPPGTLARHAPKPRSAVQFQPNRLEADPASRGQDKRHCQAASCSCPPCQPMRPTAISGRLLERDADVVVPRM